VSQRPGKVSDSDSHIVPIVVFDPDNGTQERLLKIMRVLCVTLLNFASTTFDIDLLMEAESMCLLAQNIGYA